MGQSNEAANTANRDQDFTLEVSSGSRTAAFPASSLHRLLFPDPPPFGTGQDRDADAAVAVAHSLNAVWTRATFAPSPWYSTDVKRALFTAAICSSLTDNALFRYRHAATGATENHRGRGRSRSLPKPTAPQSRIWA